MRCGAFKKEYPNLSNTHVKLCPERWFNVVFISANVVFNGFNGEEVN